MMSTFKSGPESNGAVYTILPQPISSKTYFTPELLKNNLDANKEKLTKLEIYFSFLTTKVSNFFELTKNSSFLTRVNCRIVSKLVVVDFLLKFLYVPALPQKDKACNDGNDNS